MALVRFGKLITALFVQGICFRTCVHLAVYWVSIYQYVIVCRLVEFDGLGLVCSARCPVAVKGSRSLNRRGHFAIYIKDLDMPYVIVENPDLNALTCLAGLGRKWLVGTWRWVRRCWLAVSLARIAVVDAIVAGRRW